MTETNTKENKPTIYQCKWYDTKEKAYTDNYVNSLDKACKIAAKVFQEGSKYFSINLIEIQ